MEHVARMGEMTYICRHLVGKTERKIFQGMYEENIRKSRTRQGKIFPVLN
jgi:hypothetical protein